MNKEEQDYMKQLKAAFEEQKNVELRKLTMTKERYQQLAYTYCKITDEEEMKDFAYISTHEDIRVYYLSDTNLALLERIDKFKFPKSPLNKCIGTRYSWIDNNELREEYISGHSLSTTTRIERPIEVSPIRIELTQKCWWQLLSLIALIPSLLLALLALLKLFGFLIQLPQTIIS